MDMICSDFKPLTHRISLKAYARDHSVELIGNGRAARAELIDICARGARLRMAFPAVEFAAMGQAMDLNIFLDRGDLQSGPAPCIVTWVRGREMQVEFAVSLNLGLAELQAMVDH